MVKTVVSKAKWWIVLFAVTVLALLGGIFSLNAKTEAKAEESITVTQVQFRTSGDQYFFFLRMDGQTDYTEGNQWHEPTLVNNTNLLDKVTIYFLNGSATLREVWNGVNFGTYIWTDTDTLVFQMKDGYTSDMGVGARIESGAEIPMLDGTKKVTNVVRTFWQTYSSADNVIGNYTDGYNVINTTIDKVHLRGRLNIGLGEGNDWINGVGRTQILPTEVPAADGTTTHSSTYWRKMLACNFLGKVKLHVAATDTWVTLGSIMNYNMEALQLSYYLNGWGETGGTMQLDINTAYNGTTVDKILFEKGCEFPSYNYLGNADVPYTVQVLDKNYLCTSLDMSQADWAVSFNFTNPHRVTFNYANDVLVNDGETVAFPETLSETKADDEYNSYEYNWFLNGERYDFSTPVTGDINLISDGTFTATPKKYTVTYLNEDGSVYKTEQVPYGTAFTPTAVPEKVGADAGVWIYEGGDIPTTMPAYDITLQASYNANFHIELMHFRSEGEGAAQWILMMPNETDYTAANTWPGASFVDGTNILDNVTVYFKYGAYSLRDVWDGEGLATKLWGESNAIAFRMKSGFLSSEGVGIQVKMGTEFPMCDGTKPKTMETRTLWSNGDNGNDVITTYTDGYNEIPVDVSKVHIRSEEGASLKYLLIGLGEGNDWNDKGTALPPQAVGADGTATHANAYWHKIYLSNFMNKIKLHVAETDTWVELGSIVDTASAGGETQVLTFNAWGEKGGVVIIPIENTYNGTTVDRILFEEGCTLPSFDFTANHMAYTVQAVNGKQIFVSSDMSQAHWAVSWTEKHEVTFNGGNGVLVNDGACVDYPVDLSETKEETEEYYYIYNWFLDGEIYDFTTPVTSHMNLTSDGTFTAVKKPVYYTVTFQADNGTADVTETVGEGELASQPADPAKEGSGYKYEFIGWYNGDTVYDFNTPVEVDLTLTAKYRVTKLLVLSDLYDENNSDAIFKTGEITVLNGTANRQSVAPIGYYADYESYPNFELSFDLQYSVASTETYAVYTIQMKSSNEATSNAPFYLGWKVWFYRPNNAIYFEYLQYDEAASTDVRKQIGTAVSDLTLAQSTTYSAKIGYKVIDAATGTVEMFIVIGDWSDTKTFELGAEYFANAAASNRILFSSETTDGTEAQLTFGDPGLIGKARQDVTLMNGTETFASDNANQIILPSIDPVTSASGLTQVFVGWTTDTSFGEGYKVYPAGYKLQLEATTTLYAVWIGFEMQDGAAVRLATDSSGIRFLANIDSATYQTGVNLNLIADIGTIVVPTSYLSKVEFVHGSFSANYYSEITKSKTEDADKEWKWTEENGVKTYAAAFIGISENQYARTLSARGFLKINYTSGVGYVYTPYSEADNARSIYQVATEAFNDTKEDYTDHPTVLKYVNSVADIKLDENIGLTKNGVGMYDLSGSLDKDTYTFTVDVNSSSDTLVKTAIINGTRLVAGYDKNIAIGNYVYSVKNYALSGDGKTITFTLGAAETLEDKYSDSLVYFQSSDADLDFFLNDYFKRHAGNVFEGNVDQKVSSVSAGFTSQEFFWQEWFSLAYYPISSLQDGSNDRIEGLREKLSGVPVDDYGYVWQNTDAVRDVYSTLATGEHRMGWPFPTSDHTIYTITDSYLWYDHNYETTYSASWDFNGADRLNGWTSNVNATVANGLLSGSVSGQTEDITFTSPTMHTSYTQGNPNGTSSWKDWTYQTTSMVAYYTPLLELDVRIDDASGVEDIVVEYTSTKGSGSVSVNEKAFIEYPYEGKYEHMLFLPMYAETNWGDAKDTYITSITVKIVMKDGGSMTGNVGLSYVRGAFDTRHYDNVALLISSLRQDYDYTSDIDYLKENITRARKAINFLMQAYDEDRSLIRSDYLVGHDSVKVGDRAQDFGTSIGNGYWDCSFMPEYDFHTNTYFYMALTDLAYLEGILESKGNVDKAAATVLTADRNCNHGTSAYNYDSASLTAIANKVQAALQATTNDSDHTGFWDATKGRFVAGYSEDESRWYDYGYLAWNIEAVYYGVATEEQANLIMQWVNGERTIDGDTSTGEDIYFFELAPRTTTYQGTSATDVSVYTGFYTGVNQTYGVTQCQHGGAIMYTSYYDLMSRIEVFGADNAYARLQAIQAWYEDIYEYYTTSNAVETPDDFYWRYYENSQWDSGGDGVGEYWAVQNGLKGIEERSDGIGSVGIIGIDGEFLESILPIASVYYGFFGINSVNGNVLQIAPNLPAALEYWTTENLAYGGVMYDLTIRSNGLQISAVSAEEKAKGLTVQAVFNEPTADYEVYVNGVTTTDYTVTDNKIYVDVALDNVIVEVR